VEDSVASRVIGVPFFCNTSEWAAIAMKYGELPELPNRQNDIVRFVFTPQV